VVGLGGAKRCGRRRVPIKDGEEEKEEEERWTQGFF
jgi:hypothetical protein